LVSMEIWMKLFHRDEERERVRKKRSLIV